MTTGLSEASAGYVPELVLRRLQSDPSWFDRSSFEKVGAAVLMADVSGSTALAEMLGARGPTGIETFSAVLNRYLGELIDAVVAHGGDVVKFSGDGLIGLWQAANASDLVSATRAAATCASAAQRAMNRLSRDPGETRLQLRIGVAAGEAAPIHLAVPGQRSELVVGGAAVAEAAAANLEAARGEVVLSVAAWDLVSGSFEGEFLESGAVRLPAGEDPTLAQASPAEASGDGAAAEAALQREEPGVARRLAQSDHNLKVYVPPTVRMRSGSREHEWLAEWRRTTTVFIGLPPGFEDSLDEAERILSAVYTEIDRYEGTIARLGVDEKGPAVLAAFGLPPLAHEDDAIRAVRAALGIRDRLRDDACEVAIGIASGRVLCCEVGNRRRREYTMVGNAVNLAARLMQAAGGDIVCDRETYQAARGRLLFEPCTPRAVRGKSLTVSAYRAVGEAVGAPRESGSPLVGRRRERELLRGRMLRLVNQRAGAAIVIAGEAGIGKSRLVEDALAEASRLGIAAFVGVGDAIEAATPYRPWRAIFSSLFGLKCLPEERDCRRKRVLEYLERNLPALGADPQGLRMAPLLNAVLPLGFTDNEWTRRMTEQSRVDNTQRLLIRILRHEARRRALLLVLEDAHWLDSASWSLTLLAAQLVHPSLLLVVSRPMANKAPLQYRRLQEARDVDYLLLESLSLPDARALLCNCLRVGEIDENIVTTIYERSRGNPLLSEEFAYALRDTGRVEISGEQCWLSRHEPAPADLELPPTIEAALTARIDRLSVPEQMVLKVASVLGQSFLFSVLCAVYPLGAGEGPDALAARLRSLMDADMLRRDSDGADPGFSFKHFLTKEAAYNLMPSVQRRVVHRAAAEYLSSIRAGALSPRLPLIAHHWSEAVDVEKPDPELLARAIGALEEAADAAAASYANHEVLRLLARAQRFDHLRGGAKPARRERRHRSRWERQIGEAKYRLGLAAESRDHLLASLRLAGHDLPRTGPRLLWSALVEALRQGIRRFVAARAGGGMSAEERSEALEAARSYELLGFVLLPMMERMRGLVANMRALNLSESAGLPSVLANSSAVFGLSAGVLLGRKVAGHYFDICFRAASEASDPHCLARGWMMRGMYLTGRGDWNGARISLEKAYNLFIDSGDARWRDNVVLHLGNSSYGRRRLAEALEFYAEVYESACERGDAQSKAWSHIGIASARVLTGQSADAIAAIDAAQAWLANDFERLYDRGSEFNALAVRALAELQSGNDNEARSNFDRAREIARTPLLLYHASAGYVSLAETAVRLCERSAGAGAAGGGDARRVVQSVRELRRFARFFPAARAQAQIVTGAQLWMEGRQGAAVTAWRRGLFTAQQFGIAYEEGVARYEIGRRCGAGTAERIEHLRRASDSFAEIGAGYMLKKTRAEL